MRKLFIILIILGILGGAYFLSMYFISQKEEIPQKPPEELVRAVKASNIVYADFDIMVEATGRLGSHQYVDLITEVQGEILHGKLPLKKGQNFNSGDLLFKVFDQETVYSLKASKSKFLNIIANALPDIKIDYNQNYDHWFNFFNSIDINKPLPELPEVMSDQEKTFIASRNILTDYFTIMSAEIRLQKYHIHAPFRGSFTNVYLEVGSIASPGSRVARIIRTDKLELEVPVEVEDVKWIKTGDDVTIYSEDRNNHWKGKVIREADFVDPATQSVSVFITVKPSMQHPLYEGQYLLASFIGRTLKDVMKIPRNAVFNNNEVFIIRDGQLYKETITIHKISDETLYFSGLEEGLEIVVEPLINIPERTRVEIIPSGSDTEH